MSDREIIYRCEHCSAPIYTGDKAQVDDDGVAFCPDHAAKISEVIASWQDDMDSDAPYWPEVFDAVDEVEAHIAGLRAMLDRDGDVPLVSVV